MKKTSTFLHKIWKYIKPTKVESILMSVVFVSFSMLFVSGSFNKQTKIEQISSDIACVVKNEGQVNIIAGNDDSLLSSESFSSYVNNQFYQINPFKCVIGYNLDKTVNCSFDEFGTLGEKPTFLTSTYFTNHKDTEKKNIFDRYYFEVLFEETNTSRPEGVSNFMYITKSQADYLINNDEQIKDYEDVRNKLITLNIENGNSCIWKIANIVDDSYLFCEQAHKAFNNFVVCYTLVPDELRATESILFSMYDFAYSNTNYISLIEASFPSNIYNFRSYMGQNDKVDELVSYLNSTSTTSFLDVLSIICFVIFSLPFVVILYLSFKKKVLLKNICEFSVVSILSWLLFFIVSKIFKSPMFFSNISLIAFAVIFLFVFFWLFVFWLIKRYERKNNTI